MLKSYFDEFATEVSSMYIHSILYQLNTTKLAFK